MFLRAAITVFLIIGVSACGSTPLPPGAERAASSLPQMTPIPKGSLALPDRAAFLQKDPRWGQQRLGNTSDSMASDGCLVTAAAMALANLGFATDPSDLNARLTSTQSFTPRGWLIWDGIRKVTEGRAQAIYHDKVSEEIIDSCMLDGQYPLVQFYLKNGRSHWAMIVKHDARGYHMRDPLRPSKSPLIFPRSSESFRAVRCIGLND
ncbi:hypothetical protein [Hellea balneolensis]|uniref:hypothetical protein n=1 Tax=Hellea balneolensis TaxID=287478 RepID=UPI0003FB3396|nr:hypothetical protein [Hellea balneolensis]